MGRIEKSQQSSMDKYMTPALNRGIEKGDSAGRKVTKGVKNLSEITLGKLHRVIGLLTTGKWMNNKNMEAKLNLEAAWIKSNVFTSEDHLKKLQDKVDNFIRVIINSKELDPKLYQKIKALEVEFNHLKADLVPSLEVTSDNDNARLAKEIKSLYDETYDLYESEGNDDKVLEKVVVLKERMNDSALAASLADLFIKESDVTLEEAKGILKDIENDLSPI